MLFQWKNETILKWGPWIFLAVAASFIVRYFLGSFDLKFALSSAAVHLFFAFFIWRIARRLKKSTPSSTE